MATPDQFVVLTGGPGTGKTTLLEALRDNGFSVVPENARPIIRDQLAIGGYALHTADWRLACGAGAPVRSGVRGAAVAGDLRQRR
jgi:predicted ATPase